MRIDVVTLFPRMFEGVLSESILKIAQQKGLVDVRLHDLRHFTTDKHRKVDAPPYGGGAGMVLQPEPVFRAVEKLRSNGSAGSTLVLLTPAGRPLTQKVAKQLSRAPGLILLCGHYEGVDERVVEGLKPLELSIGDYVLTGGELPAMVVIDAVVRLLPGVLGSEDSPEDDSFARGTLEYPHYTRPSEFRGMAVPEVLLSGHHADIAQWRDAQAVRRTRERRPDLLKSRRKKAK